MTSANRSGKSTNVRTKRWPARVRGLERRALQASLRALVRVAPRTALRLATTMFFKPSATRERAAERGIAASAERRVLAIEGDGARVGWEWPAISPEVERGRVLLVHGWSGRALQLGGFVAPLREHGFTVVAYDLAAHGRSGGRIASLVSLAEDLLSIDERHGPFAGVIAHSFGGAVTGAALLAGFRAERLAFVAPPLEAARWLEQYCRMWGLDGELAHELRQNIERRVGVPFEELNGERIAPHMNKPLLVVHDENDREVRIADGARLAAAWPDAELFSTSGLGHQRILHDPAVIDAVVRFVRHDRYDNHNRRNDHAA